VCGVLKKALIEIDEKSLRKKIAKFKDIFRIPRKFLLPEHLMFEIAQEIEDNCKANSKHYGWRTEKEWWSEIVCFQPLTEKFLIDNEHILDNRNNCWHNLWYQLFRYQKLSEKYIMSKKHKIQSEHDFWYYISCNSHLTEDFIDKYKDKLAWSYVCSHLSFTEQMIEKYVDNVDWKMIWENQNFTEDFIIKHQDKVEWTYLVKNKHLAKDFFERNKHRIATKLYAKDLVKIVEYQKLSQETLETLKKGKMVWGAIGQNCDMSRDFVITNYDKMNPSLLVHWNNRLNDEVKQEVKMIERLSGNQYI
jgi:hypothetical protein